MGCTRNWAIWNFVVSGARLLMTPSAFWRFWWLSGTTCRRFVGCSGSLTLRNKNISWTFENLKLKAHTLWLMVVYWEMWTLTRRILEWTAAAWFEEGEKYLIRLDRSRVRSWRVSLPCFPCPDDCNGTPFPVVESRCCNSSWLALDAGHYYMK